MRPARFILLGDVLYERFHPVAYLPFVESIKRKVPSDVTCKEYGTVTEGAKNYPLVSLTLAGDPWLLVTAGFHGEERSGPLSVKRYLSRWFDLARKAGIGLTVYPCINPAGFELDNRYGLKGGHPNNSFLSYEVAKGDIREEIPRGGKYLRIVPGAPHAQESRLLRDDLEAKESIPSGHVDLHQDGSIDGSGFFAYVLGKKFGPYRKISRSIKQAPCRVGIQVDTGGVPAIKLTTDKDGLVSVHDGTLNDYLYRQGVPYIATVETSFDTPLRKAMKINGLWVEGFISLVKTTPKRFPAR